MLGQALQFVYFNSIEEKYKIVAFSAIAALKPII
jgi:hypothetical protein